MIQTRYYNNEREFIDAVNKLSIPKEGKQYFIEHELAHGRRAAELGYKVRYTISLKDSRAFKAQTRFRPLPSKYDMIQILSAPEKISASDKARLEKLAREIGEGVE